MGRKKKLTKLMLTLLKRFDMLELNRIYNSDRIEGMKQIESGEVDLIVTDPPYCIAYKTGWRADDHRFSKEILNDDNEQLIIDYMSECYRILKDDSAAYIFCSAKTLDFFMQQARNAGFTIKNVLIWRKNNHTAGDLDAQYGQCYEPILYLNKGRRIINGKRLEDVWDFDRVPSDKLVHQNEKPIPLLMQCILKSSNEGDLVFDGFMGSASTALACMRTNRNYLGFELDEDYFKVAQRRIKEEKLNQKDMFGYAGVK